MGISRYFQFVFPPFIRFVHIHLLCSGFNSIGHTSGWQCSFLLLFPFRKKKNIMKEKCAYFCFFLSSKAPLEPIFDPSIFNFSFYQTFWMNAVIVGGSNSNVIFRWSFLQFYATCSFCLSSVQSNRIFGHVL